MDKRHQYYGAMLKMMETRGWKLLVEDMENQIAHAKDTVLGVSDMREVGLIQGRIGAFAEILVLEDNIRAQLAELDENADL